MHCLVLIPDQAVWVQGLARVIVLCSSWERHLTRTLPYPEDNDILSLLYICTACRVHSPEISRPLSWSLSKWCTSQSAACVHHFLYVILVPVPGLQNFSNKKKIKLFSLQINNNVINFKNIWLLVVLVLCYYIINNSQFVRVYHMYVWVLFVKFVCAHQNLYTACQMLWVHFRYSRLSREWRKTAFTTERTHMFKA